MRTNISFRVIVVLLLLFSENLQAQDRQPAVAGSFYPGNAEALTKELRQLFQNTSTEKNSSIAALIVPHAGYIFSGKVAATGYAQIPKGKAYKNVFIIGVSHRIRFNGVSIYPHGNYLTPLGKIPVNDVLAEKLINENRIIHFVPGAHRSEHSIEVQLPFLQYHLKKGFCIVPILTGDSNPATTRKLAEALLPYFTSDNLFIISTDFSHYPPNASAQKVDKETADAILSGIPEQLQKVCQKLSPNPPENVLTRLCGESGVLTLMEVISGKTGYYYHQIIYQNSSASPSGDPNRIVGYCAISVTRDKAQAFHLTESDKSYLLKLARNTIETYLKTGMLPKIAPSHPKNLQQHCGAFVTLSEDGSLRGCIGQFNPSIPLVEVVRNMAIAASTKDTRFPPVQLSEMNSIKIEISVLTPLHKISNAEEFHPGKQGIYIKKGNRSGTYLPQVAEQTGWDRENMLGHCSRDKAGIGWNGWKNAELYTYEAIVFHEK
ncbi:AmmeMemoRadiSam system protein B [Prolixibacter sp. SD074]|uniref:AmmeMemoRadiSam system protein B n=1 Tax=Prolixibacter sp. SD074 TaxID=2652391 RepID=UPI001274EB70|nr:AmmeMemoRadiSam system protein B [Prolixibacter sp. SD074]GET29484.1 MEMO1 family protein [Prolixibacter sp. SD074]